MRRMATITTLIRGPGRPDLVLAPGLHEPQHRRSVAVRGEGVAPRKPRDGAARRARGAKGCDADGRRPIHSAPSLTMVSGSVSDFVHGSIGRSVDNTEPRISRSAVCCPRARTPSRQPRNAFFALRVERVEKVAAARPCGRRRATTIQTHDSGQAQAARRRRTQAPCAALEPQLLQISFCRREAPRRLASRRRTRSRDSTAPRRASMARGPGARDGEEPGLEWHSNSKAWASTAVGVLPALRGVSHARGCRRTPQAAPGPGASGHPGSLEA